MTLFERLFGPKLAPVQLEHRLFGKLTFSQSDTWENRAFTLWDTPAVQLIIRAGSSGPTVQQEVAFVRFRDGRQELLPRCLAALADYRLRTDNQPDGRFTVASLAIPPLDAGRGGHLWTLWFDCEGEEHYMYGVQTQDDWKTIVAFADD